MIVTIICGSQRQNSESFKVGKYLQAQIEARDEVGGVEFIDLSNDGIPFWDDTWWTKDTQIHHVMAPHMEKLTKADALVIISPEWGGMVPGALKNFMLYWTQEYTGHKPAMLVSVSSTINGAYPIAELRHSGYKNSKLVYLPDHLIVRNVKTMLNDHDPEGGEGFDHDIRDRASYTINMLIEYAKVLKPLRSDPEILNKKYTNGM